MNNRPPPNGYTLSNLQNAKSFLADSRSSEYKILDRLVALKAHTEAVRTHMRHQVNPLQQVLEKKPSSSATSSLSFSPFLQEAKTTFTITKQDKYEKYIVVWDEKVGEIKSIIERTYRNNANLTGYDKTTFDDYMDKVTTAFARAAMCPTDENVGEYQQIIRDGLRMTNVEYTNYALEGKPIVNTCSSSGWNLIVAGTEALIIAFSVSTTSCLLLVLGVTGIVLGIVISGIGCCQASYEVYNRNTSISLVASENETFFGKFIATREVADAIIEATKDRHEALSKASSRPGGK